MYLRHFGLKEFPFSITPDTSFFFSSDSSQEALNTLLVAVRTGEGFIKITGEVGTGKTLLCRKLMSALGEEFYVAHIPNPSLDAVSLFYVLCDELAIEGTPPDASTHQLVRAINEKLLQLAREGRRAVICLDEAQSMPIETLEALRLLTNLETEKRKLLQVIIFGQPEVEHKLSHPSIRQLKQRIAFHYELTPLERSELDFYLHHRMVVAGYQGNRVFSPLAVRMLEHKSRRVPRLVNILAHKALLSAFGRASRTVGRRDVAAAAHDTASVDNTPSWAMRVLIYLTFATACLAVVGWVNWQ
jgi:MSHA biogenesis protein MshM